MANHDHDPAFVIKDGAVMNFLGAGIVAWFVRVTSFSPLNSGHLWLLREIKHAMKNRMIGLKVFRLPIREEQLELFVKIEPFAVSPKVVHHQKTSVEQIPAQDRKFIFFEGQAAWLHNID